MIALVAMLLAADPAACATDADCELTTLANCCDCCPSEPRAAPKSRCRGVSCPARACPKEACKKVPETTTAKAVCRENRCTRVAP
ncbi:MAG: hypothetical protein JNK82_04680 [Myxococcaceae bacterium]|nr:hypothetical protein [Myxococcaceae bacterium]